MVQNMVGCDMGTIEKAAYDPVFYLHNTFIDYLWAYWQELQRLRGKTEDYVEKYELDDPLPPFDRADFNHNEKTLKHNKDRDVLDYQSNLCYEYQDLRFNGMTPAQFLKHMADDASDKGYDNDKGYGYGKEHGYGHND